MEILYLILSRNITVFKIQFSVIKSLFYNKLQIILVLFY